MDWFENLSIVNSSPGRLRLKLPQEPPPQMQPLQLQPRQ